MVCYVYLTPILKLNLYKSKHPGQGGICCGWWVVHAMRTEMSRPPNSNNGILHGSMQGYFRIYLDRKKLISYKELMHGE